MKLLTALQIREWDQYTIANEPISSLELMERAATQLYNWIQDHYTGNHHFKIFCGKGNNGGDGLALARMLLPHALVTVYVIDSGNPGTSDFNANLKRLEPFSTSVHSVTSTSSIHEILSSDIIVDAIFGTGLNKPPEGIYRDVIEFINKNASIVIAVDIPSGMYSDRSVGTGFMIRADHTLTFQQPKLAFMMTDNSHHFGEVAILDIGLHKGFSNKVNTDKEFVDKELIASIYKPRHQYTHKGNFGHAALLVGSKGLMGAATLSVRACLRGGAGKVTAFIPSVGYDIMQISAPEAMSIISGEDHILDIGDLEKYDVIAIGPGLGLYESNNELLYYLFKSYAGKPFVIDADALNIIARDPAMLQKLPVGAILTPHTIEFDRLFPGMLNDFHRMETAAEMAIKYKIFIVLKAHNSVIATPDGHLYFNSTGNAGMATGGSGDVLTGVITSLVAQQYSPPDCCILGVYLHGLAGDIAAQRLSQEALIAGDLIDHMGDAYKAL